MRMQEPDCEICGLSDDDSHPTKFTNHSCREVIEKPLRAKLQALESQLKQAKTAIKALSNHEFFIQHFPSTAKIFAALSDNAELKKTHENP